MERYDRPYRRRARGRGPEPDAMTAALTAQVILCALLIVCLLLVKNFNGEGFGRVKAQYREMCSDTQGNGRVVAWFTEPEGVFGRLYAALGNYFGGIFGATPQQPAEDDSIYDEPQPELAEGYSPTDGVPDEGYEFLAADGGGEASPVFLSARIMPPVTGVITSGFSSRESPITGKGEFHSGLDIAAEEGREIRAALPGEVSEVGYSETYGNYIILKHATNLQTFYAHCSEILSQEGDAVEQGACIAKVGQTGATTGPHLHFGVIIEGEFADPEPILSEYIRQASQ